jgi:3-dehydroquinate synthase
MSLAQGWLSESEFSRIKELISQANLPIEKPNIDYENFIGAMRLDKKNRDKEIYLVLQQGIGKAIVTNKYASNVLDDVIKS